MEIDQFLEKDIINFLDARMEKKERSVMDREEEYGLYLNRDYLKEIETALDNDELTKAKRLFDELKSNYNKLPKNSLERKKIYNMLEKMYAKIEAYVDMKDRSRAPLSVGQFGQPTLGQPVITQLIVDKASLAGIEGKTSKKMEKMMENTSFIAQDIAKEVGTLGNKVSSVEREMYELRSSLNDKSREKTERPMHDIKEHHEKFDTLNESPKDRFSDRVNSDTVQKPAVILPKLPVMPEVISREDSPVRRREESLVRRAENLVDDNEPTQEFMDEEQDEVPEPRAQPITFLDNPIDRNPEKKDGLKRIYKISKETSEDESSAAEDDLPAVKKQISPVMKKTVQDAKQIARQPATGFDSELDSKSDSEVPKHIISPLKPLQMPSKELSRSKLPVRGTKDFVKPKVIMPGARDAPSDRMQSDNILPDKISSDELTSSRVSLNRVSANTVSANKVIISSEVPGLDDHSRNTRGRLEQLYVEGIYHMFNNDFIEASKVFERIIELRPVNKAARIRLQECKEVINNA